MLVQEGSIVIIDGLMSEVGQRLNGKKAKAIKYFLKTCRWSVQLVELDDNNSGDDDDDFGTNDATKQFMIHIKNLTLHFSKGDSFSISHIYNPNPYDFLSVGGELLSVLAGTVEGDPSKPAVCILGDVLSADFDKQAVIEAASMMGAPKDLIKQHLERKIEELHANREF